MFARSTTIAADPSTVEAGIAYYHDEVMPVLGKLEGCVGMSLVVDRASGRCIASSSWVSQATMSASDDLLAPLRAQASRLLGGRVTVEEWEVALMHRAQVTTEGAWCRITRARTSQVQGLLEVFRTQLPSIEQAPGFCSASMFVDRWRGVVCVTVTFDSRAALGASRETAAANREAAMKMVDVTFEELREAELVVANLRVPELV